MGGGKKDTGRKSVADKYEASGRKSRIPTYPTTMLVDLQVFVIPREKWVLSRRLYRHNIVEEGISFGFVRVLPQLTLHNLRRELAIQLGQDVIPRDFIFIRSVGNIFIQMKPKQEIELKVKNFLPPFTAEPEIYILEVLPSDEPRMMSLSPLPLLLREETPPHICHDLCHHSRAMKRDKILREITEDVQLRHDAELRRAELIQKANDLQARVKEKREKITRRHEFWHKKFIEESALTRPVEAACNTLRAELNTVHRRLLAHLEGRDLPLRLRDGPSKKANYKIMAARLQHEIKELQQKTKAAKLRLESEIKLKEQADRETREIREDLSHKKVLMSLARSQAAALPVVHPKTLPYEPLLPRAYDPLLPRAYDSLLPRGYDPLHSRSYESLYQRSYDSLLGY